MSPEQLHRLGELAKESNRAFDAELNRLLEANAERADVADRSSAVRWSPAEPPMRLMPEEHLLNATSAEVLTAFAGVLACFGAPDLVRDARKQLTDLAPELLTDAWYALATHPVQADPDTQALCCLRALRTTSLHRLAPARDLTLTLYQLAHKRLSELLIAYPALLHPRLVFADNDAAPVKAPMLLALSDVDGALPSSLDGFDAERLEAFATHPCVHTALRMPGPTTRDRPAVRHLCLRKRPNVRLATTLLELERLQKTAAGTGSVIHNKEDALDLAAIVGRALLMVWAYDGGIDLHVTPAEHAALLAEIRRSDVAPEHLRFGCLQFVGKALIKPTAGAGQRVGRLIDLLDELRLVEQRSEGARLVLQHLLGWRAEAETTAWAQALQHVDAIKETLYALEVAGIDLVEIVDTLRVVHEPRSQFLQIAESELRRRVMEQAIDAETAGQAPGVIRDDRPNEAAVPALSTTHTARTRRRTSL